MPSATAPLTARPQPNACDAVVDERRDHDEAGDRAGAVAERGGAVVVERGERARGDPRVDLRGGRRDEPRQQLRRARLGRGVARQEPGDRVRRRDRDDDRGHERDRERETPTQPISLPSRPASRARANSGRTTTRSALATSTTAT